MKKPTPSFRDLIQFKDDFITAIDPLQKMRVDLRMSVISPQFRIDGNSGVIVEVDEGLTPMMKEIDAILRDAILKIKHIHERQFAERYDT